MANVAFGEHIDMASLWWSRVSGYGGDIATYNIATWKGLQIVCERN